MKTNLIPAYSYTRFSTGIQAHGRSQSRQQDAPEVLDFIKHHNLRVVQQMVDAGVSGYSGKNFTNSAALGQFVQQIRQGNIERGSVLIVENLDRFSRDNITDCISRFTEIIKAGVSIGVVAMNIIIDLEQMNNNSMLWNYVSNEFQRARAESKRKSRFSTDIIQDKLARAGQGDLVHFAVQSPSWILGVKNKAGQKVLKKTEDKKGVTWMVDNGRVATVKRVYEMYLAGESCNNIAAIFNREKVPSLKSGTVNNWSQSTVKQILENKNVVGWDKMTNKDDYYPAIISAVDFQKVQARLKFNSITRGGSVDRVPNVFRGLMVCKCGSAIDVVPTHNGTYNYSYCRSAIAGTGCMERTRVLMPVLELAIFGAFQHPNQLTVKQAPKTAQLEALQNQLASVEITITRFADVLADPDMSDLAEFKAKLKAAVARKEALQKQIADEQAKTTQIAELPKAVGSLLSLLKADKNKDMENTQAWADSFTAFMKDMNNRKAVRGLIPSVFQRVVISHSTNDKYRRTDIACTLIGGRQFKAVLKKDLSTRTYSLE